ncbi:MAG: hypothetical protein AAFY78_22090 [Cyanobacteria bacterium J06648_16]
MNNLVAVEQANTGPIADGLSRIKGIKQTLLVFSFVVYSGDRQPAACGKTLSRSDWTCYTSEMGVWVRFSAVEPCNH